MFNLDRITKPLQELYDETADLVTAFATNESAFATEKLSSPPQKKFDEYANSDLAGDWVIVFKRNPDKVANGNPTTTHHCSRSFKTARLAQIYAYYKYEGKLPYEIIKVA